MHLSRLMLGLAVGTIVLAHEPALASEKQAEECIEAAIRTSDATVRKGLKIYDHEFNCHTVKRERRDYSDNLVRASTFEREGVWIYSWRLSHALRLRTDDQVDFRIEVRKSRLLHRTINDPDFECLTLVSRRLNRGGFAPIPGAIGRLIGQNDWEEQWRRAAQDFDSRTNKWEDVADLLGARVASEIEDRVGCDYRAPRSDEYYEGSSGPVASSGTSHNNDADTDVAAADAQTRAGSSRSTARVTDRRGVTSNMNDRSIRSGRVSDRRTTETEGTERRRSSTRVTDRRGTTAGRADRGVGSRRVSDRRGTTEAGRAERRRSSAGGSDRSRTGIETAERRAGRERGLESGRRYRRSSDWAGSRDGIGATATAGSASAAIADTVWAFDTVREDYSATGENRALTITFSSGGRIRMNLACGTRMGAWSTGDDSSETGGSLAVALSNSRTPRCADSEFDDLLAVDLQDVVAFRVDDNRSELTLQIGRDGASRTRVLQRVEMAVR